MHNRLYNVTFLEMNGMAGIIKAGGCKNLLILHFPSANRLKGFGLKYSCIG